MKLPINVSESTKRLNPELFGVGRPQVNQSQPTVVPPLASSAQPRKGRKSTMVVCVHIISFCRRLLDEDNSIAGAKFLRDAIAKSLGCSDADPRITWNYSQIKTKGQQGVAVKIELI